MRRHRQPAGRPTTRRQCRWLRSPPARARSAAGTRSGGRPATRRDGPVPGHHDVVFPLRDVPREDPAQLRAIAAHAVERGLGIGQARSVGTDRAAGAVHPGVVREVTIGARIRRPRRSRKRQRENSSPQVQHDATCPQTVAADPARDIGTGYGGASVVGLAGSRAPAASSLPGGEPDKSPPRPRHGWAAQELHTAKHSESCSRLGDCHRRPCRISYPVEKPEGPLPRGPRQVEETIEPATPRPPAGALYFVQSQLGHKDIQTTIDLYGHPDKPAPRAVAERAAAWWRVTPQQSSGYHDWYHAPPDGPGRPPRPVTTGRRAARPAALTTRRDTGCSTGGRTPGGRAPRR